MCYSSVVNWSSRRRFSLRVRPPPCDPGTTNPWSPTALSSKPKEQLGGFFIIEARDLNQAIHVASKHPAANLGEQVGWAIEARPIEMYQPQ